MDVSIFVLGFLQGAALLIYRWVGRVFISQPVVNHPGIFDNPTARFVLCYGPLITMVVLVVLAFVLTISPWLFLGFSLAGWVACSPRPRSNPLGKGAALTAATGAAPVQMSIDQQNLYEIIGLPPDAGRDLIEKQCIHLGERYRPDKNAGDLRAALIFAQIEKAYETLLDLVKRAAYDAELRSEAIAQDHAAFIGQVNAPAKGASALTTASGDISLHSKINSWIALLFLLVVCNALSGLLSRLASKWLQTNNFEAVNVAILGGVAGVTAAFVVAVMFGRFLAGIIPLWPPLSGILMTRGATEITRGKRIVVTVALLVLVPGVMVGGSIAKNLQKEEAARIAAEETKRVAEETARKAVEEQARILEAQVRAAEENARVLDAQARAAEGRAAASYDAHARAEAKELARIEMLRTQCESWGGREPVGTAAGTAGAVGSLAVLPLRLRGIQYCAQYDQARNERQHYEALRRQGR